MLKSYQYCLCPENSISPGYYTEKIPESFASQVFPIGWYLPDSINDFADGSHLNIATLGTSMLSFDGSLSRHLLQIARKISNEIRFIGKVCATFGHIIYHRPRNLLFYIQFEMFKIGQLYTI